MMVGTVPPSMLDGLASTCEGSNCDRRLTEDRLMMEMRTDGGVRRAYECTCGAVTVTVATREA
ncbi:hypothetical protein BRD00_07240 [Halobacteriales archaeon QS_8_69_26]|nr:MAG: hypothetical protein BRD00_07240 [Halobacteriales archaeon QS_8_69_26]